MESTPPLLCSMTRAKRTQLLASFSFNYSNYNISFATSILHSINIGLVKCATADQQNISAKYVLLPGHPYGQIVSCQNKYQDEHDLRRRRRLFNCFTSSVGLLSKNSDQGLLSTYLELSPPLIIPLYFWHASIRHLMLNNISDI